MKRLLLLFTVVFSILIQAQGELKSASADIYIEDNRRIVVKQNLKVNVPDSIWQMNLKLLKFDGTLSVLNEIKSDGEPIKHTFAKSYSDDLHIVEIESNGKPFTDIELNYTVAISRESFYIPIFFTELLSTSSNNDFFEVNIIRHSTQNMILHFPKVNQIESDITGEKITSIQVPALPSLIKMELPSSNTSKISVTTIVDWVVALVFVLIGIIIWKKRNQLRYG